jgi:hypothetical protein
MESRRSLIFKEKKDETVLFAGMAHFHAWERKNKIKKRNDHEMFIALFWYIKIA